VPPTFEGIGQQAVQLKNPTVDAPDTFKGTLRRLYETLAKTVNGQISFGDGTHRENIDGNWVSVTTPGTANTDFTVNHALGRVPVGYIVVDKAAAVDVYTGSVGATKTQLTLRATVINVAIQLFIF